MSQSKTSLTDYDGFEVWTLSDRERKMQRMLAG